MNCDVCKQPKSDLTWVSGASGAYVVCPDCARPHRVKLDDAVRRIDAAQTLDTLLGELLAAAIDVSEADMGNVQLVDEDRTLRIHAQTGFEPEFLDFFNAVHDDEAACGTAAASRKTVAIGDVELSPIFVGTEALPVLRNAFVRAVQSTPIFARSGALIGMVSTHYRQPHEFADHELDLLSHLASRAADRLERFAPTPT